MAETKALRVTITGVVQGVYFRQSTAQEATRLGVLGWVRNLPDGTVEAHVQGPAHAVDALLTWCHRGPPAARVDRVEVREAAAEDATGFVVRR